jgi:hypothetical protein
MLLRVNIIHKPIRLCNSHKFYWWNTHRTKHYWQSSLWQKLESLSSLPNQPIVLFSALTYSIYLVTKQYYTHNLTWLDHLYWACASHKSSQLEIISKENICSCDLWRKAFGDRLWIQPILNIIIIANNHQIS